MIDLSSNGIHFLPDKEKLENLKKVEYFNFHKNLLVGWRQLENLTCLTNLRHMTLQGNPCAKIKGYRQFTFGGASGQNVSTNVYVRA